MRVLGIDPGAKRCGWAVVSYKKKLKYHDSGIFGLERDEQESYQDYRLHLLYHATVQSEALIETHEPEVIVNEIIPVVGSGNFVAATQNQLAATVLTTVQVMGHYYHRPLVQLGASTVKKAVTGRGDASKVKVRDGVLTHLPELEPRRPEWTGSQAVFDEVDALAVALTYCLERKD